MAKEKKSFFFLKCQKDVTLKILLAGGIVCIETLRLIGTNILFVIMVETRTSFSAFQSSARMYFTVFAFGNF